MREHVVPSIVLLLFLLVLYGLGNVPWAARSTDLLGSANIYIQAEGDVVNPGVYEFRETPSTGEVLQRAGGALQEMDGSLPALEKPCATGVRVRFEQRARHLHVQWGEMSAYHKLTLGIPISLNREEADGLVAVPGIGEKLAREIVRVRAQRGGFRELGELMSIKGIGPKLYHRICRHVML